MKKIVFPWLAACVLALLGCATSGGVYPATTESARGEVLKPHVEPWEDGLRTDPESKAFEWWYFDVSFTDGSTAVIVFATKNILTPGGKPDPQVSIVITTKEGKRIVDSDNPGYESFSASQTRCDVRIGGSRVAGDLDTYTLEYNHNGIEARLELVSKAPAWRPGEGTMYFDSRHEKYFAWLPAVPYGVVRGSLTYEGTTRAVTGSGYHDHNWGNVRLDRVITQWYWGRAHIGDYTLIFSETLTSSRYGSTKVPVFYLARGNRILSQDSFKMNLVPSRWVTHTDGREYPERVEIEAEQDNGQVVLRLSNPEIIEARSLVGGMPSFVRFFVRLFSNPYYFRFNTVMTVEGTLGGREIQSTGTAIFEMMLLRGKHTAR